MNILLIDPAFNPETSTFCNLLIKVGMDSLSYAIIKDKNQVVAVFDEQECENCDEKLSELLKTDPYLKLNYKAVKISVHTPNFITIPNDLYNEADLTSHTQYFIEPCTENLYVQPNTTLELNSVYTFPHLINNIIQYNWGEAKKLPQATGLVLLSSLLTQNVLLLDFTVGSFHILYKENNKLVFQQCFQIDNVEEFNYYLLLIVKQLNIDTKNTNVYLSGIIHQGDNRYNCLHQYFTSIEFLKINSDLDQQVLDDMPAHYYTSLLALDLCE
jgi:hypothetical protein